jgi:hypothetical protein
VGSTSDASRIVGDMFANRAVDRLVAETFGRSAGRADVLGVPTGRISGSVIQPGSEWSGPDGVSDAGVRW